MDKEMFELKEFHYGNCGFEILREGVPIMIVYNREIAAAVVQLLNIDNELICSLDRYPIYENKRKERIK